MDILIKTTYKDVFSFYCSEGLTEFILGSRDCQVCVKNMGVDDYHLKFLSSDGDWFLQDISREKTTRLGRKPIGMKLMPLKEGDVIHIYPEGSKKEKPSVTVEVMRKINSKKNDNMSAYDLTTKNRHLLGRNTTSDVVVNNPAVESAHVQIIFDGKNCLLEDLHTISGTFINNVKVKRAKLNNYDRLSIPGAAYIFYDNKLLFSKSKDGIEIKVEHVEKEVVDFKTHKKTLLLRDITFTVAPGEMAAIVGGSGAGKSTLVDCINGLRPCTAGKIFYDNNDYYENINSYRGVIGIVPQKDVMHDDLTVFKALSYTAQIKLRSDLKKEELKALVQSAIADVKLRGKENLPISSLSGGQKKRVSIAMELLSEPKVLFLDEPTSGLSPDLDLEMMELLKELAAKGRTVIIITHAMENIDRCDKVAFLGQGGRLCFFDSPTEIEKWFSEKRIADIFKKLADENTADDYAKKYRDKFLSVDKNMDKTGGFR